MSRYIPSVVPNVHQFRENCFMYDSLVNVLRAVLASAPSNRVLSLGSGTCSVEWRLAKHGFSVTAVDSDPGVVAFAKRHVFKKKVKMRIECQDMFERSPKSRFGAILVLYSEVSVPQLMALAERQAHAAEPGALFLANMPTFAKRNNVTKSFVDVWRSADRSVSLCLSRYHRDSNRVTGDEVYLVGREGGRLQILHDITSLPVGYSSLSRLKQVARHWRHIGWRFLHAIPLDQHCPTASPPFCAQALFVWTSKCEK